MTFHHLTPLAAAPLVCIALLSACASTAPAAGDSAKPATVAAALAEAETAVRAGQKDRALAILRKAGSTFPTDKAPWVRMAQMHFDSTNYGAAIVDAQEALERDPDDTLAHSIVAVSGLRVTSRALADISKKNHLTGNVRTEAQDLAKLLRTSLNEAELVPNGRPRPPVKDLGKKPSTTASTAAPAPRATTSSDPLGILK
jgi:Flp pilus assembly protein TadD